MIPFALISLLLLASAALALSRRNLVHSALLLALTWAALAAFYLWAGAEFLAFAQVLVYVGAVSMVVLFAVLLTRQSRHETVAAGSFGRSVAALVAGAMVAGVLAGAILSTPLPAGGTRPPALTVRALGLQLMQGQALPLLITGVILTVALLGGIVLASGESGDGGKGSR